MYERAVTTLLKNNMLVYFAYADFEEVSHIPVCLVKRNKTVLLKTLQ